jgi:hypothetical protein
VIGSLILSEQKYVILERRVKKERKRKKGKNRGSTNRLGMTNDDGTG